MASPRSLTACKLTDGPIVVPPPRRWPSVATRDDSIAHRMGNRELQPFAANHKLPAIWAFTACRPSPAPVLLARPRNWRRRAGVRR
jgi:hypothetical protein